VLEDIRVAYEGGGTAEWAQVEVPDREVVARYPEAQMFGRLPAYGLYVRHARDVAARGMEFSLMAPDARPAVVFDDVAGARVERCRYAAPTGGQPVMSFTGIRDALVKECTAMEGASVFLRVFGDAASRREVRMEGNVFPAAMKGVEYVTPEDLMAQLPSFSETSPGIVAVEAEQLAIVPPMAVAAEKGALGGAVIGVPAEGGRDLGKARARFAVRAPGKYVVKVRAFAAGPEEDSFYFSIDGGRERLSDFRRHGGWAWDFVRDRYGGANERDSSGFELSEGEHTLALRNREAGLRIDALAIVRADRLDAFEHGPGLSP